MKRFLCVAILCCCCIFSFAQGNVSGADQWVDSVLNTLSKDQKIAQLIMVRLSSIGPDKVVTFYNNQVADAVRKYNIGGICLFQGGPLKQAALVNQMQSLAKTPILIAIDGENGLGMRLDSVMPLPRQMMLGAVQDASLVYAFGRLVGEQCKRMGIHVNFAPVVDINNNPANPVINDRSFGQDRKKVAEFGIQYMRGLQDAGVMAVAKHFPGHGDVSVDSHLDLPVVSKSRQQLDSLELYPFRELVNAGVDGIMIAHLQVPAVDNTAHTPTSISYKTVTKLLRDDIGFKGLTFTDALEMKGVTKYFPGGEASLKALIAGNDILCLPGSVSGTIATVKKAIAKKQLSWSDIDAHVRRVLYAKYRSGLAVYVPANLVHLTEDLNNKVPAMRRLIAENALTLLKNDDSAIFPLAGGKRVAYVGIGINKDNEFAAHVRKDYEAHVYYFGYGQPASKANALVDYLKNQYDVVVIGVHNYARFPANNFGISPAALRLITGLQQQNKTITLAFGNPYAIRDLCGTRVMIACYEDDDVTQDAAADLLFGRFVARGLLPVSACESFTYGSGILQERLLPVVPAADLGFQPNHLNTIDSIVNDAIVKMAMPGAVVLVVKDGKVAYERSFGFLTYDSTEAVYPETIYDLASMTKIMATTVSVMKLYDERKIDLQKTLGDYLPWLKGSNKAGLKIWDVLLHQAGLKAWIPFYRETVDTLVSNAPLWTYYSYQQDSMHRVRVAENIYLRNDWVDTMYSRILSSELGPEGKYVYSDNDFIFMGKIVEAVSGMPLDRYVKQEFYDRLGMKTTGFHPRERFPLSYIAPTEQETGFRGQLLQGDVHDPGAAMFGGVAGHAGLFSDAYDLAILGQVLLNGGTLNGHQFFRKETVDLFTAYHSDSRRGLGFDKPEKDNATRAEPYPAASASPLAFGHTGFTGTCMWMDPQYNLTFIMLANRVNNNGDANRFLRMNVRIKVLETIYQALHPVPRP